MYDIQLKYYTCTQLDKAYKLPNHCRCLSFNSIHKYNFLCKNMHYSRIKSKFRRLMKDNRK
jgi:hypothetical protein